MSFETITQDGRERIIMDREDYENLVDARDHAVAMRDAVALTSDEMDEYLAAKTPLAFWRKRAGKTQAGLAEEIGISQPFLAQLEAGQREGGVGVLMRIAKVLGLRIEDLIEA